MPDWYAVYTEPSNENYANEQLRSRRFNTLFPHTLDWFGIKTAAARLVRRAYYPRYLFVNTDPLCLATVQDCPGVCGIVRSTDRMPFPVDQEAVQAILDKTDCLGLIHEIPSSRVKYGPLRAHRGDRVQLDLPENNPLWNLAVTIADVDGEEITATLGRLKVRLRSDQIGKLESRGTTVQRAGPRAFSATAKRSHSCYPRQKKNPATTGRADC